MSTSLFTPLCELLECRYPILLAGMGGVARHRLASAVSEAGGFPALGMVREPCERIHAEVLALRETCAKPFAVNLIPRATAPSLLKAQVDTCLQLEVPFIELFWDVDTELIRHLKAEGVRVIHQVGNRRDAEAALKAGVDVLIAQGNEAGGHVRGTIGTLSLLAELLPISHVPVVAAGGIASGRTLAAALAMGAQGANLGTALLATAESNAHLMHKERVVQAGADDTIYTRKFHRNWHEAAPVRVLRNSVTRGERRERDDPLKPVVIGQQDGMPVHLYSTDSPLLDATGELEAMALYAGQSCGQISMILTARQRIEEIVEEAQRMLKTTTLGE